MGTLAALAVLQQSLTMATQISALISTAHAEKRDVTMEELNGLVAEDDIAKAALDAAIKRASQ